MGVAQGTLFSEPWFHYDLLFDDPSSLHLLSLVALSETHSELCYSKMVANLGWWGGGRQKFKNLCWWQFLLPPTHPFPSVQLSRAQRECHLRLFILLFC